MISRKPSYLLIAAAALACSASAQTWTGSGSTGADGAFDLTTTQYSQYIVNGIFIFNPVRDNLDVNATNIYNFTTVNIPNGVTVQVRANMLRTPGPMVWLASGAVTINGIINVSGNNGHDATSTLSLRSPSEPGPGGFPGGAGAKPGDVPQRGFGPGSGVAPAGTGSSGCSAGFATAYIPDIYGGATASYYGPASRCAGGGGSYGTATLQPFIGGSGGSGGYPNATQNLTGPGGGAGGGAFRITSDVSITFNPPPNSPGPTGIYANGGNPGVYTTGGSSSSGVISGGGGSGGSVHLQAPTVILNPGNSNDSVAITSNGGSFSCCGDGTESASAGRIRIDTNSLVLNNFGQTLQDPYEGSYSAIVPDPLVGPLVNVPLPTNQPTISVVSVNGVNVPAQPAGGYSVPDLSINNSGNIPIVISTTNIPNTTINLYISTEPGTADFVTPVTLTNGTGSANITLPQGVSRFVVRATW
jgi:hypothetical protein